MKNLAGIWKFWQKPYLVIVPKQRRCKMVFNCQTDFNECNCPCHGNPHMEHCMPCCAECSLCGKKIRNYCMDTHLIECRKRYLDQIERYPNLMFCNCHCHQNESEKCDPLCCTPCKYCRKNIKARHMELHHIIHHHDENPSD